MGDDRCMKTYNSFLNRTTVLTDSKPQTIAWLLFFSILVAAMPLCSASLGTFKQGDMIKIRVLTNCSTAPTLIEVSSPNNTYIIDTLMTSIGGQTYSSDFYNTSSIGTYSYSWNDACLDCSQGGCGNDFTVTVTGQTLTTGKAISYIIIFVISFIIMVSLILFGTAIDGSNKRDQMTGYIIALNNMKYLKIFFYSLAYIFSLFLSYFAWMVCYAYLDMTFVSDIFRFIFYTLTILTLPFFILGMYFVIANWIRDTKVHEALLRGLRTR